MDCSIGQSAFADSFLVWLTGEKRERKASNAIRSLPENVIKFIHAPDIKEEMDT